LAIEKLEKHRICGSSGTSLSTISADEYFDSVHRIVSLLDEENVTILRTMKQHGPRNLLEIARKAKLPYTTVYNRVTKLESQGVLKTWIYPNYPKIGLSRAAVLVTPHPGKEIFAREALKVPGFWLKISRCLGDINGYYSQHAVPTPNRHDFELYLEQLLERGVIKKYRVYWLGEAGFPLTNFDYFKPKDHSWKFDWKGWLEKLTTTRAKPDSSRHTTPQADTFDKRDLVILRELTKDARTTLADLSKLLGLTLPATKYRFDKLVARGLVQEYVIDLLPFAPQISKLLDLRLDFKSEGSMRAVENALPELPIVQSYSLITGLNSMTVRIYLPQVEVSNLFAVLSLLVSKGVLTNYSYLVIDPMTIESQTFSHKEYNDGKGWNYDSREYLKTVDNLIPKWTKTEIEPNYQTLPQLSIQL
jgi:Lrp/AsnC family transcriptional regulator, leucine-responsive regulatory protein